MTNIDPVIKAQHVDPVFKDVVDSKVVDHARLAYAVGQMLAHAVKADTPNNVKDLRLHLIIANDGDADEIVAELVAQGIDPREIAMAAIKHWQLADPNPFVKPSAASTAASDPFSAVPPPGGQPTAAPAPSTPPPATPASTAAPAASGPTAAPQSGRRRSRGNA